MLPADSIKIGHLAVLENLNENHKQNLILVPGTVGRHNPLNRLSASQLEPVLRVLQLLKRVGFYLGLLIISPDCTCNGVRLFTPETLEFIGASVALDSPMKLPAIPVGDEGTLLLRPFWVVIWFFLERMRTQPKLWMHMIPRGTLGLPNPTIGLFIKIPVRPQPG